MTFTDYAIAVLQFFGGVVVAFVLVALGAIAWTNFQLRKDQQQEYQINEQQKRELREVERRKRAPKPKHGRGV
jgi:hypothetical protein